MPPDCHVPRHGRADQSAGNLLTPPLEKTNSLTSKHLSPQTFTSPNTHKHTSPATLVHSFSHCSFLWMFPYFPTSAFSHKAVTHIIYFMYCAAIKNAAQPHERKKYITVQDYSAADITYVLVSALYCMFYTFHYCFSLRGIGYIQLVMSGKVTFWIILCLRISIFHHLRYFFKINNNNNNILFFNSLHCPKVLRNPSFFFFFAMKMVVVISTMINQKQSFYNFNKQLKGNFCYGHFYQSTQPELSWQSFL